MHRLIVAVYTVDTHRKLKSISYLSCKIRIHKYIYTYAYAHVYVVLYNQVNSSLSNEVNRLSELQINYKRIMYSIECRYNVTTTCLHFVRRETEWNEKFTLKLIHFVCNGRKSCCVHLPAQEYMNITWCKWCNWQQHYIKILQTLVERLS